MFSKRDGSNINLENNFFFPLEYGFGLKDSLSSKEKHSVGANTSFFPLEDASPPSQDSSIDHEGSQPKYDSIETFGNRHFARSSPTQLQSRGRNQERIQQGRILDWNCPPTHREDSTSCGGNSESNECDRTAESNSFGMNKKHFETSRTNLTSYVLSIEDEDVIEFDFNDEIPCCVDLLSGATLEKTPMTLNELNKKVFNSLHEFRTSKDNPEENLVELILPNCVALLNLFDEVELSVDPSNDVFEFSTFINTIEFIVRDIWTKTLRKNLNLVQALDIDLEGYKDKYMIDKLNGHCPSTSIVGILRDLKYFPNSVLETFKFGIKLKEHGDCSNEGAIMQYVVFNRIFCTAVLEIQKCYILISRFMNSVNLLKQFSNKIFLSFIEILVKIVFECQLPQLFLGIGEIIELWLQGDGTKRRQLLREWRDTIIHDINQSESRNRPDTELDSTASSAEEDEHSLRFNKWDVIEPFLDNIMAL
ncbi:hypothetical protein SKDZ_12G3660 [Saccharomyces kudriavzevii ZP591]|nr:hypothetical protein SKDZ_12G3660 [Saccharomyces kudriavzevii ZP591]